MGVESAVTEICRKYGSAGTRLLDILRDVQQSFGCVSGETMDLIAAEIGSNRVDVESVLSSYSFLSKQPKGKIVIRLSDDIIGRLHGYEGVADALSEELGISLRRYYP